MAGRRVRRGRARLGAGVLLAAVGSVASPAGAHVKWFSNFSYADPPSRLREIGTPFFFALALLAAAAVAACVVLDRRAELSGLRDRLETRLSPLRRLCPLVMRIGAALMLLLAWRAGTLFAPELHATHTWVGWLQLATALALVAGASRPGAAGIAVLYALGIWRYGGFHLLDYTYVPAIAAYLALQPARRERVREAGLQALYVGVGFSLFWVALEKLVYPRWSMVVLGTKPGIALGFPFDLVVPVAAFVELSLGYLVAVGLLQRPLAILVTLVFLGGTLAFGRLELIGHTPLHAALLVLWIEGPGRWYEARFTFPGNLRARAALAALGFLAALGILLSAYAWVARHELERSTRPLSVATRALSGA